jgi:hypothetical protein
VNGVGGGACALQTQNQGRIREHGMSMDVTAIGLARPCISNSSGDNTSTALSHLFTPSQPSQGRLEGEIWLRGIVVTESDFPKGASEQRCRSLSEAEDAQTRRHWSGDLCSMFKSASN